MRLNGSTLGAHCALFEDFVQLLALVVGRMVGVFRVGARRLAQPGAARSAAALRDGRRRGAAGGALFGCLGLSRFLSDRLRLPPSCSSPRSSSSARGRRVRAVEAAEAAEAAQDGDLPPLDSSGSSLSLEPLDSRTAQAARASDWRARSPSIRKRARPTDEAEMRRSRRRSRRLRQPDAARPDSPLLMVLRAARSRMRFTAVPSGPARQCRGGARCAGRRQSRGCRADRG